MISKPSRFALSGMALVCAAILAACNDAPRLQFLTVAPLNGNIYESISADGAVRGAARRGARPGVQSRGTTGRRAAAIPPAATATCGSLQYAATAVFSNGSTQDASGTATWSSSDTTVAAVSTTGLASGVGLGTTNIGATFNGVSATSEPLLVDQLNSITVTPSSATQPLGSTQQFFAVGNFSFAAGGTGNLDISSQVTWNSSNPDVATIDNTGNATSVGTGTTDITATSCDGLLSNTAKFTVGAAASTSLVITPLPFTISTGTTTLLTAMEKLSDGTTQPIPAGTVLTWSSDTTTVATVDPASAIALGIDPASAIALGVGAGTANITATETVSGFTGSAALTVQAASARFAYIADGSGRGGSGGISGYSVDVTGGTFQELTTLGSPFAASSPQQVLIHPSGDFMYYIDGGGTVHVKDINAGNGSLSDPNPNQAPVTASAVLGANVGVIDPLGRFLYVICDNGNSIYAFSINHTVATDTAHNGALTNIQIINATTDSTLNAPTWILTDRTGKYAYVANNAGNTISQYTIDQSSGMLTLIGTQGVPTGAGPLFATTDVNGHIYVANSGDGTVSVFSIGSGGVLSQVGSSNFSVTGANTVFNVVTDPTGIYLYVLDSPPAAGQVFAFNLDATGAITTPIGSPVATGQSPIGMAIDPTGALLAVDNNFDATISLFKVTLTGAGAGGLSTQTTVNADSVPQFVTFYTAGSGQ